MKKLLLLFVLVIFCVVSFSQNSKYAIGLEFTPTETYFVGDHHSVNSLGNDIRYSFSTGLSFEYFICKHLSLKSEVNYERKGTKTYWYPNGDCGNDIFISSVNLDKMINFDYLILPVWGSFSTSGKIRFYINTGFFLGVLISQKNMCAARDSLPERVENNYNKMKKLDFGLSSGLGLRIPIGKKLLLDFGLCLNTGLIDVNKSYLFYDVYKYVLKTNSNGFQLGLKYRL